MINSRKQMLLYTKTIYIFVKCLKLVENCCLHWSFFHSDLYYYIRHSNVEYQDEIFKSYH